MAESSAREQELQILSNRGLAVNLQRPDDYRKRSLEWAFTARNRRSWSGSPAAREKYREEAIAFLCRMGIGKEQLKLLGQASLLETGIPFASEESSWPDRIMPWEFLLSQATKPYRGDGPFAVVRHLKKPSQPPALTPEKVLFIESAPGPLRLEYHFNSERRLIGNHFSAPGQVKFLTDPGELDIERLVKEIQPGLIHLTGIDTYQGLELLGQEDRYPENERRDGIWLKEGNSGMAPVDWERLARVLCAAPARPAKLFVCNAWHSAARICSMAVGAGISSAIGFQDEFDDAMAELFINAFYGNWRRLDWDVGLAFSSALETIRREMVTLKGTGIVLWNDTSLLAHLFPAPAPRRRGKPRAEAPPPAALMTPVMEVPAADHRVINLTGRSARDILVVKHPKPVGELNYSMLHNDRELFEEFTLALAEEGVLRNVRVAVTLNLGSEKAVWEQLIDLRSPGRSLKEQIRVPLVSPLIRSLKEKVHTTITVEVQAGDETVMLDSFRVALLPVDEWRDDDANRKWLPSFVRPNDPAVNRIIELAQKYLCLIADDATASFDGYQSIDEKAENPCQGVDNQVQAIWWALLQDISLRYINPPPSFTMASQRLRTPGNVIASGRGTCIDLALLLASCLEYVEICPVIFLLKGHAFPGYLRNEGACGRLRELFQSNPEDSGPAGMQPFPVQRRVLATDPWVLPASGYPRILEMIEQGDLIPLETVWLTSRKGFWASVEEGMQNLRDQTQFEALYDICEARRAVTPLPMQE